MEFGDRTRDCSPGHAEKDGPHLAMMGTYCGFSGAGAPDGFPTRYDGELREPLMWCQGSQVVHAHGEGESVIALESW